MKRAKESPNRQSKEQNLAVALPGDLYEQAGQWWWRTALPGEDKAKARPLRPPGAGESACDRAAAEKIAVEMWGQAATQHGARQITLDCTQKVERLKAQFLDKIRQLTVIVESANAKAQAEATARAEIEARLNAMIQAAEHPAATPSAQTQILAPVQAPEQEASVNVSPNPVDPVAIENHDAAVQTGICECCGAPEVPVSDLEAIDSGQLLCRECIEALHIDISRIEAKTLSNSRV